MISIIIPIYNVGQYIVPCLESVVGQTYKDIEIVLVDDASTDDSIFNAEKYLSSQIGANYKIYHHEINSGLSAARNTGLNNASGEYIYFLDSDDIIESTAIENLYNAITSGNFSIAISYFSRLFNGKISVYREDWLFDCLRIIEPSEFADRMLTEKSNFASTAKLYKKEIFKNVRFRLGKRNEDTLLIVDLIPVIETNGYQCIDIPDYSYFYRMREGSICHNLKIPLDVDVIKNYEEAINICKGKESTIEWLKQQQLSKAFQLAWLFLNNKEYKYSLYKDDCKFLSHFSCNYIRQTRTKYEFKKFIEYKYASFLYWTYYRIKMKLQS